MVGDREEGRSLECQERGVFRLVGCQEGVNYQSLVVLYKGTIAACDHQLLYFKCL